MSANLPSSYFAKFSAAVLLLLSFTTSYSQDDAAGSYAVDADQVLIDETNGTITYAGNARVVVANLVIQADSISIVNQNGLPAKITASGDPIRLQEQVRKTSFNGTARQVTFLLAELKLTLIDYSITDQAGNSMKGKKASFVFAP